MAQSIGAGEAFRPLEHTDDHGLYHPSGLAKPKIHFDDYFGYDSDDLVSYSPRQRTWGLGQRHDRNGRAPDSRWSPSPEPEHRFFIIREGTPPRTAPREAHLQPNSHQRQPPYRKLGSVSPPPIACLMARTDSGRLIMTETDLQLSQHCPDFSAQEDREAARRVKKHMANPRMHVKRHEDILRTLIHPRSHADKATDFPRDNAALESIFSAADQIFFEGRLARRVNWEWSSGCVNSPTGGGGPPQGSKIIGTTALRRASPPLRGGYETLIVLSSPILKDTSYNRRLLISTFLHELIHSYLFICCGFRARHCGGHTGGFKEIAAMIDDWAGKGTLRLCDMEADLEHFREEPQRSTVDDDCLPRYHHNHHQHHHHGDSGGGGGGGGGVDFYDLSANSWSTGPRVVFGAQEQGAEVGWDRGGGTPITTTYLHTNVVSCNLGREWWVGRLREPGRRPADSGRAW